MIYTFSFKRTYIFKVSKKTNVSKIFGSRFISNKTAGKVMTSVFTKFRTLEVFKSLSPFVLSNTNIISTKSFFNYTTTIAAALHELTGLNARVDKIFNITSSYTTQKNLTEAAASDIPISAPSSKEYSENGGVKLQKIDAVALPTPCEETISSINLLAVEHVSSALKSKKNAKKASESATKNITLFEKWTRMFSLIDKEKLLDKLLSIYSFNVILELLKKFEQKCRGNIRKTHNINFFTTVQNHYISSFTKVYRKLSEQPLASSKGVDLRSLSDGILVELRSKDRANFTKKFDPEQLSKEDERLLKFFIFLHNLRLSLLANLEHSGVKLKTENKVKKDRKPSLLISVDFHFGEASSLAVFALPKFGPEEVLVFYRDASKVFSQIKDRLIDVVGGVEKTLLMTASSLSQKHSFNFKEKTAELFLALGGFIGEKVIFNFNICVSFFEYISKHGLGEYTAIMRLDAKGKYNTFLDIQEMEGNFGLTLDWSYDQFFSFYNSVFNDSKKAHNFANTSIDIRSKIIKTIRAVYYCSGTPLFIKYSIDARGRCYEKGPLSITFNKFSRLFFYFTSFENLDEKTEKLLLKFIFSRYCGCNILYQKYEREILDIEIFGYNGKTFTAATCAASYIESALRNPSLSYCDKIELFRVVTTFEKNIIPVVQIDARSSAIQIIIAITGDRKLAKIINLFENDWIIPHAADSLSLSQSEIFSSRVKKAILMSFLFNIHVSSLIDKIICEYHPNEYGNLSLRDLSKVLYQASRKFHAEFPVIRALKKALCATKNIPWNIAKTECLLQYTEQIVSQKDFRVYQNKNDFKTFKKYRYRVYSPTAKVDLKKFNKGALPNFCHFLDSRVIAKTVRIFKEKSIVFGPKPAAPIENLSCYKERHIKCVHDAFFVSFIHTYECIYAYNKALVEVHKECIVSFPEIHAELKKQGYDVQPFTEDEIELILKTDNALLQKLNIIR